MSRNVGSPRCTPETNITLNVNYTALKKNLKSASLGCEEPGVCVISNRAKELFQDKGTWKPEFK